MTPGERIARSSWRMTSSRVLVFASRHLIALSRMKLNQGGAGAWLNLLLLAVAISAFPLTGCRGGVDVPREVRVPVPVPCVDARPVRPRLRDEATLLAMDRYARTIAAWADLKRWEAYGAELEAVVEACSRVAPSELMQHGRPEK